MGKVKTVNQEPPFLQTREVAAPLSIEMQTECNKLVTLLAQVPHKLRGKKVVEWTGGAVSVSDVVAYLIGWGELLIDWYENGIDEKEQMMPGEGFDTWDYVGLAKHFYKKYSYKKSEEQEERFFAVVLCITSIVEYEHSTGNLKKMGVWPWCTLASGKQWPLEKWVRVNTVAPYKRAAIQLRRLIKNQR
jgi:hypothetical protein